MEKKPDIFDRIMACSLFSRAAPFYKKYKGALLYMFFGVFTTLVGIGTFQFFLLFTDALIANIPAWVAAVTFAYVTNRTWVFTSERKGKAILRECAIFFSGRLFTLVLEEGILYVFITLLTIHPMTVKVLAQIMVLLLNYIISKLLVFRQNAS